MTTALPPTARRLLDAPRPPAGTPFVAVTAL